MMININIIDTYFVSNFPRYNHRYILTMANDTAISQHNCATEYSPFMRMDFMEGKGQIAKSETRIRLKSSNMSFAHIQLCVIQLFVAQSNTSILANISKLLNVFTTNV